MAKLHANLLEKYQWFFKGIGILIPLIFGFYYFFHFEIQTHFEFMQGGRGDGRYVIFLLEHWFRWLQGKEALLSPPYFYPVKHTLGYSDVCLALVPLYSLFRIMNFDVYTASQSTYILCSVLNYLVCLWFLRKGLAIGIFASSLGAAFFAFNSVNYNQLGHSNFAPLFLIPLISYCFLTCHRDAGRTGNRNMFSRLAAAALLIAMQLTTAYYIGWFLIFWSLLYVSVGMAFPTIKHCLFIFVRRYWRAIAGSFTVFLFCLIPFFLIFSPVFLINGPRSYTEVEKGIPDIYAYMWMGPTNHVWGLLSHLAPIRDMPLEWEKRIGLGLVFSVFWVLINCFCIFDILKMVRGKKTVFFSMLCSEKELPGVFLITTILSVDIFCVLTFKFSSFSLWRLIYLMVPGAQALRVVSRFMIFLTFPMTLVFSFCLQKLVDLGQKCRLSSRNIVKTGLLVSSTLFLFWEQSGDMTGYYFNKKLDAARIQEMASRIPPKASTFFLAVDPKITEGIDDEYQMDAMMTAQLTGIPTINGYSSTSPPYWYLNSLRDKSYYWYIYQWISRYQLGPNVYELIIKK